MSQPVPAGLVEVGRIPLGFLREEAVLLVHKATGMRVVHCKLPGPLCQVDVIVPTECNNNKGLPHCLEHLVFTGSLQHPSRGFLDKLANLCLAQGTNAWTDRDHTAYNAITAGHVGLMRLLPVFLDHVVHPTLSEEQFITEIYHVDGQGKQNGVVFCEMQGREATEDDMSDLAVHRLLFPGTGYEYECGGLTPEIATLNNDLVREYHSRFYRTDRILLLVHGQVPLNEVASAIDAWHVARPSQHTNQDASASLPKPWTSIPPPLAAPRSEVVKFPAEDESVGSVTIAWTGPHIGDVFSCVAIEVLFRFLQEGAASPIAQAFVECAEPLASSVEFDLELRLRTCISLTFSGVPNNASKAEGEEGEGEGDEEEDEEDADMEDGTSQTSHGSGTGSGSGSSEGSASGSAEEVKENILVQGLIQKRLRDLLTKVKEDGLLKAEDMLKAIRRHRVKLLEECEEEPADALHNYVLPELLFYEHIEELRATNTCMRHKYDSRLNQDAILAELENKDGAWWAGILDYWILSEPNVEVVMVPCATLAKDRADAEARAVEARKASLGDSGLALAKDTLAAAVETGAPKPLPPDFIIPPIPPADSICRLSLEQEMLTLKESSVPVQVVRLATHFHHVTICLDASSIPTHLRPYINLIKEMLMSTNVLEEDGTLTDYKEVVKRMQADTVSTGCALGVSGGTFSGAMAGVFVFGGVGLPGGEGYNKLCEWLHKILFRTRFDEVRVTTCVKNMLQDIKGMLRDGSTVCATLTCTLTAEELVPEGASGAGGNTDAWINDVAVSLFRQKPFLSKLKQDMSKPGKAAAQEAVAHLEELRRALVSNSPPVMIQIGAPIGQDASTDVLASDLTSLLSKGLEEMHSDANKQGARRLSKRRRDAADDKSDGAKGDLVRTVARDARVLTGVQRRNVVERCVIVPVEGIDSAYLEQVVPCSVHKSDEDYMPVYFLTQMLSRSEGPLWVGIRGVGYAYHASLELCSMMGQLMFSVGESSAPAKALQAFHDIVRGVPEMLASPEAERAMAETRASIMYSLHSRRSTASGVMHQAIKAYFSGSQSQESDLDAETLRLSSVGIDDLLRVWRRYFTNFLQSGVRCTSVACVGKQGMDIQKEIGACLGVSPELRTVEQVLLHE